jgi:D-alanyl-D-alanine carboxypeptidase
VRGSGYRPRIFMLKSIHRLLRSRILALAAIGLFISIPIASPTQLITGAGQGHAQAWVAQASAGLDSRIVDALRQIVGPDRRLLALRGYLRAHDSLAQRWSWSQEQIAEYPSTPEGKAAAAEIEAVGAAFAAANPGFSLHVNRNLRSLEVQIAHWNTNESVGKSASDLITALEQRYAADAPAPSADQLRAALEQWKPDADIALAVPGLSPHGQGRAFDFQIARGGRIIAGAELASAIRQWDAPGWTDKLHSAVSNAGPHFAGPLVSPYEPWHYSYASRATGSDQPP